MRRCHLQKLSHLGKKNKNKLKANAVWVRMHLHILQKTIAELEKKCGEPAGALLQVSLEETLKSTLRAEKRTEFTEGHFQNAGDSALPPNVKTKWLLSTCRKHHECNWRESKSVQPYGEQY